MIKLSREIINFFQGQGYAIISTIDANGMPHSACKDIVMMDEQGRIYLLDLYLKRTYDNLKTNPNISVTVVDEHKFKGYCLKGKARIVGRDELSAEILGAWEARITARITQRMIKNLHEEKGHARHPEARLPKPRYLILAEIEEIVDLTPLNFK
jgi:uncharacterized pyridoxamine 5'-phosphate oxidase family protein